MAKPKNFSNSEPKGSQIAKRPPELEGIEFADDGTADPRPNTPLFDADENARKRSEHAKAAEVRINRGDLVRPLHIVPSEPMSAAAQAALAPKLFRVLKDAEICRGAGKYILKAGKIISSRGFDIPGLQAQGIQLEPWGV